MITAMRYPTVVGMTPDELIALRKEAGLSRKELANTLRVDTSTISHWENGRAPISEARAQHIRLAMGMEVVPHE